VPKFTDTEHCRQARSNISAWERGAESDDIRFDLYRRRFQPSAAGGIRRGRRELRLARAANVNGSRSDITIRPWIIMEEIEASATGGVVGLFRQR